jgi:N-acetylglutamate synthase-like GNAT family acetyltransferase
MITIGPHRAAERDAIAGLIVAIQRDEFGFDISLEDQPDLSDIAGFYDVAGGTFLVARDGDRVVGTIALKDLGNGAGALRKMFVESPYRGGTSDVAGRLLAALVAHALAHGLDTIALGTTERFLAAHRFYEKHGFERIDADVLPAGFPRMTLDSRFYRRRLGRRPEREAAARR